MRLTTRTPHGTGDPAHDYETCPVCQDAEALDALLYEEWELYERDMAALPPVHSVEGCYPDDSDIPL